MLTGPGPAADAVCDAHGVFSDKICIFADLYSEVEAVGDAAGRGSPEGRGGRGRGGGGGALWDAICTNVEMVAVLGVAFGREGSVWEGVYGCVGRGRGRREEGIRKEGGGMGEGDCGGVV